MSDRKKIGCWEWKIALVALVALIASGCYMDSKIRDSIKTPETEAKASPLTDTHSSTTNKPSPITLANLHKNGHNGI